MKKILFTGLLAFVATMNSMIAQPQLFFGAGAGLNFSKLNFSSGFTNEYIQVYRFAVEGDSKNLLGYDAQNKLGFQASIRGGIKLGERFEFLIEPSYYRKNVSFRTNSVVKEPVEGSLNLSTREYLLDYEDRKPGLRSWDLTFNSVQIPLLMRFKFFGDRFGMNAMAGISFNMNISGKYNTQFRENEGDLRQFAGNPKWFTDYDDAAKNGEFKPVSNEYVVNPGSSVAFGKTQLDQFTNFYTSVILSPGMFYQLDDDGKIKITLDWRWDVGLGNLYSPKRTEFLRTKEILVVNPDAPDQAKIEQLEINGTQKLRSGVLTLGVEICPSCGF